MIQISADDTTRPDVRALLDEHLADMFATSPAESVHALDHSALSAPGITFWTAREGGRLLGCGALKEMASGEGEIKSMRTTTAARRRGVGSLLLGHIIGEAEGRGYARLLLETGTEDYFAPARNLYLRNGFVECPPFGSYSADPHSTFMSLTLQG
ncbi:GNAT family N-acetyltransferase [Arthrobacter sp. JZ12]|uniref:GNAT family N-acetyltransferase n=1 Tax=Arthrobacter sp. JZ12 TaxID=2654190 RepID=UPI002B49933D|nr:GNAT family N-acetyltransferase [Arthrobacter sp. JZ12]WRH23873.1 GNAT family N-acetyltransferase [Arthrobacter sp. JZ12]